jgi:ABC-type nitrate/sulfonate/bicarbonate transport system substrate-binding protein
MRRAFALLYCTGVLIALPALDFTDVQAEPNITTMVFQGVQNLPLYSAQQKGFFAKRGIAVDQRIAQNSKELRDGLAQGRYQIVHTAVDNAIAMAEQAKVDVVVILGGDNGWNDLIAQPGIKTYADFRGKAVVVDAPDTAFAFQLYKMLKLNGVGQNEYTVKPVGATRFRLQAMTTDKSIAGAMLNLPFSFMAQQAGLQRFATALDVIGPYLSTTAFSLRSWAHENSDTLARYVQAYIEGLRWASRKVPLMEPQVAA